MRYTISDIKDLSKRSFSFGEISRLIGIDKDYEPAQARRIIYEIVHNHPKTLRGKHLYNLIKQKNCFFCDSENKLHIHHIDRNDKNNDEKNWLLLCHKCHFKLHKIYRIYENFKISKSKN